MTWVRQRFRKRTIHFVEFHEYASLDPAYGRISQNLTNRIDFFVGKEFWMMAAYMMKVRYIQRVIRSESSLLQKTNKKHLNKILCNFYLNTN